MGSFVLISGMLRRASFAFIGCAKALRQAVHHVAAHVIARRPNGRMKSDIVQSDHDGLTALAPVRLDLGFQRQRALVGAIIRFVGRRREPLPIARAIAMRCEKLQCQVLSRPLVLART